MLSQVLLGALVGCLSLYLLRKLIRGALPRPAKTSCIATTRTERPCYLAALPRNLLGLIVDRLQPIDLVTLRFIRLFASLPTVVDLKSHLRDVRFVEVLQDGHSEAWLVWLTDYLRIPLQELCNSAALHGHVEALEWLRRRGCPWVATTCVSAAYGGHQAVLAYLLREKCPVPDTTVGAAVEVGQIGLAKWLVAQGCVVNDGSLVMAVRGGHIECVQWLVHDVGVKVTDMLIYNSVGNLAFLEWLDSEEHHPLDFPQVFRVAAAYSEIPTMKWCVRRAPNLLSPATAAVYTSVLSVCTLECAQWLADHGMPMDADAAAAAAEGCAINTMKWLHARGVKFDHRCVTAAAEQPSFELLDWLISIGAPVAEDLADELTEEAESRLRKKFGLPLRYLARFLHKKFGLPLISS